MSAWKDYYNIDWSLARCAGVDPDSFFPDDRGNPIQSNSALRKVCEGCPILVQCANYAIKHEQRGFWGGLSAHGRREIRKANNLDEPVYVSPISDRQILAARARLAREEGGVDATTSE